MNNKQLTEQALSILWRLEDQLQYECPEVSEAINLLQKFNKELSK